jgi:hypothetical protein
VYYINASKVLLLLDEETAKALLALLGKGVRQGAFGGPYEVNGSSTDCASYLNFGSALELVEPIESLVDPALLCRTLLAWIHGDFV